MLAGCVLGYCVYLTWSALTSETVDRVCVHNGGTGSRGIKVIFIAGLSTCACAYSRSLAGPDGVSKGRILATLLHE